MHLLVIWTWATDWEWRWAQTCPDQHNSNQSMMLYFVTITLKANALQIVINIFISAWSHEKFYVYFEGKVKYIYIFFLFACPIQSSVSRVVGKGLICSCSSLVRVSCIQLYTMSSIITVTLEMLVRGRLCLDMLTLLTQTSQTLSSSDRLDCSLQNIRTRDTIQGYSKQGCWEQLR